MRITTRAVWQMTDDGFVLLERECFEYVGPVAEAKGDSSSPTTSTQTTATQNLNLQEIDGVAVAGVDGNVSITTTDQGAVNAARDIVTDVLDVGAGAFQETVDLADAVVASSERSSENALDFARTAQGESIDFARDTQSDAFRFVGEASQGFNETVGGLVDDFISVGENLVGDVLEFASGSGQRLTEATAAIQARESGNTDARLEEITRIALIGAGLVVAIVVFRSK